MRLYSMRSALTILKDAGVPICRITFLSLEKKGIIPRPQYEVVFAVRDGKELTSRAYTEEDIYALAEAIKTHWRRSKRR